MVRPPSFTLTLKGLHGVQTARFSVSQILKARGSTGEQNSRHEPVALSGPEVLRPASCQESVEHKRPVGLGVNGRSVVRGTPTSASFLLYDLDQITHLLLAVLSTSVKWDYYYLPGRLRKPEVGITSLSSLV